MPAWRTSGRWRVRSTRGVCEGPVEREAGWGAAAGLAAGRAAAGLAGRRALMSAHMARWLALLLCAAALVACDRNVAPFVPGEQPRAPDLSRIFPAGAEESERMRGAVEMPPAPGEGPRGADAFADAPPIRGVVRLADGVSPAATAVLFVIARTGAAGPPLAVKRIPSPSFPLAFEVGPGDRMIASRPFAGELTLTARLDGDGNAISRQPGDLEGEAPGTVEPGASGVEIVLDEIH